MFENIGTTELIVIGVIILIFFGSSKLKEVARGLGESSNEIKRAKKELDNAVTEMKSEPLDIPPEPKRKKKIANSESKKREGGKNNV